MIAKEEKDKLELKVPPMNLAFAELNPVELPTDFPNAKMIGLIMNKLACRQYPLSISRLGGKLKVTFGERLGRSSYTAYNAGEELKIPLRSDDDDSCIVHINTKDCLFRVEYRKDIYSDPNENPFLQHSIEEEKFTEFKTSVIKKAMRLTSANLWLPDGDEKEEVEEFIKKRSERFYASLKWADENMQIYPRPNIKKEDKKPH